MKSKQKKILKRILQKINCFLMYIIIECQLINLMVYILKNCITVYN